MRKFLKRYRSTVNKYVRTAATGGLVEISVTKGIMLMMMTMMMVLKLDTISCLYLMTLCYVSLL